MALGVIRLLTESFMFNLDVKCQSSESYITMGQKKQKKSACSLATTKLTTAIT